MWELEDVTVVGGGTFQAAVSTRAPARGQVAGQMSQRFQLMVPTGESLQPPARIRVRDVELRVLGTQVPPFATEPTLILCELVMLDLPDAVEIVSVVRSLNDETARFDDTDTLEWSGAAHVMSGVPESVDVAGEQAPRDMVTVTLPLAAPYSDGLVLRVTTSRTPGLTAAAFRLSGEVLDSSADARRVIGYRLGV